MSTVLQFVLPLAVTAAAGVHCARPLQQPAPAARPAVRQTPADTFATAVQPMLARRCEPCHVPGGQMYGRLPFDKPEIVRQHREGILRRLKDAGDDRATLERWLAPADARGSGGPASR